MAVYKIFASADSTLYSAYPTQNSGLDEILEVGCKNGQLPEVVLQSNSADDIRRSVVTFSNEDIVKAINLVESTGSYEVNLRLYFANAENLNTTYTLYVHPLSQSWDMGTGKFLDTPEIKNGVSWKNKTQTLPWIDPTSYFNTVGGGTWNNSISLSQSFNYKDSKDLNIGNLSSIVNSWHDDLSTNYGLIVKMSSSIEQNTGSYINLNFFSVDTHTIYPPTLEFKWDDSSYSTGSLSIVSNNNAIITLGNNPNVFKDDTSKYIFTVNARDKYPARAFTTSSIYTVNKALPSSSYWALQDVKTEELVIDFDTNYTKISCNENGSYFPIYINGLEPERYYKVLIRVDLPTGESIDIDGNNTFKIIR
jgi:hypothetical protein